MTDPDLPEARQARLARRLETGGGLAAAGLAAEFGVSVDTIRRDLGALERAGLARRVRGGALPATPAPPLRERASALPEALLDRAARRLAEARTILLDGGTSVAALARRLDLGRDRLVVTPSPHVAAIAHDRGIATVTIGGPISTRGGIATGSAAEAALAAHSADIAVLGACGLEAGFGLTSDDLPEAAMKRAMAAAARRTAVLAGAGKLGRRARHLALEPGRLHLLFTDARPEATRPFADLGLELAGPA